jgi:acetoacetate decarboxylase
LGYVKTPEEIERIQSALRNPRFVNARKVTVEFLSEPATIERLLPPGFEPLDRPLVTVMIGRYQSNCVGDFAGGSIYLGARFGDVEGGYALQMWMDTDHATLFGRDLYGEPKKIARAEIGRDGSRVAAFIERGGVRLVDVAVELRDEHPPSTVVRNTLNVKARPAAGRDGLEEDAIVVCAANEDRRDVHLDGSAALTLTGTDLDPVDELPVVEVLRGTYVEGDASATLRTLGTIPAATFLPYALGRNDDWSLLDTSGRGVRSAAAG